MTKIAEMWEALASYQPHADANGHGKSWARMCEEKTSESAQLARKGAIFSSKNAWAAACTAAWSLSTENSSYAKRNAKKAVNYINIAIKDEKCQINLNQTN